jgi:Tripartite tricarboxylate transporter TctB family
VRERLGLVDLDAAIIPRLGLRRRHVEQAARLGNVVGAGTAGEQAVVADAVEAERQDVDQKSADELGGGQRHDLLAITIFGAIVLPSEGHVGAVACDQPAIGNGDAVGIARQIGQHGLWPAALGYDNWRTGSAWDSTGPQPGYFPFYLSAILGAASLYGLVTAFLSRQEAAETFVTRAQLRRVMAVFVPTLLFCLAMQFLGLYVASFLLIAILVLRFWGRGRKNSPTRYSNVSSMQIVGMRRTGFALVWIATIHIIFRADRPYANCNSVTFAELSSVRGSGPPPRCSRARCRSPYSSRQHLLRPRLRRLRVSARRRAVPRCRW